MLTWEKISLNDLPDVAKELLPHIQHNVIKVNGEMGAGKTTFIKILAKEIGVQSPVNSPTFSIVNEYDTKQGVIYHFDFYRINHEEEAYDIGWEEYAYSGNLCLVEWAEKIENLIPEKCHTLEIHKQDNLRRITFQ